MRGKAFWGIHVVFCQGITPAYAGKSLYCEYCTNQNEDHPRLCGEKESCNSSMHRGMGSPPPMRGKAIKSICPDHSNRITPAYAGKRYRSRYSRNRTQDHPRLCGEKQMTLPAHLPVRGSPPPMRGKAGTSRLQNVQKGITPAYAGKSFATISSEAPFRDHPRLCGEKFWIRSSSGTSAGSPPPMRGKASTRYKTAAT